MKYIHISRGGSFPFVKSGDSPFYFPDREKMSKSFPFGKQTDQLLYTSAFCPANKYVWTDRSDKCTGRILNELFRIGKNTWLSKKRANFENAFLKNYTIKKIQ